MAAAIVTEGLGKRYRLGERGDAYGTLRSALRGAVRRRRSREELWALRDVDLQVEQGEVVGVIGRNGAGKTTLLKLIARITEPTTGVARMRGRVGALLEVGTGFHFELTGRENVFFNGAVLGMSRAEIEHRFDEIVEFAGVGRFLDTPLKRYSAGMYLRLAFSVAAHLEPDIVIVDEVLAVGDAEFRARCAKRMAELQREQRTILLVSHDLAAVQSLCSRSILLDRGRVRADGPTEEVVRLYLSDVAEGPAAVLPSRAGQPVELRGVRLTDAAGHPSAAPRRDEPLVIRLDVEVRERLPDLDLSITLLDERGVRLLNDALSDNREAPGIGNPGTYRVSLIVEPLLVASRYTLGVWVGTATDDYFRGEVLSFELLPGARDGERPFDRPRLADPPLTWKVAPLDEAVAP